MKTGHGWRLPALAAIATLLCQTQAVRAEVQPSAAVSVRTTLLAAHNDERRAVGVQPMVWDDALARRAQVWAQELARTGRFDHDKQRVDGENLWMGTKGYWGPRDMVQTWIDEKQDYRPGTFPHVSRTGNWADVGHYTQLIWHNTTRVGCAIAQNRDDEFLVCRYNPPGNWIGQRADGRKTGESAVRKGK